MSTSVGLSRIGDVHDQHVQDHHYRSPRLSDVSIFTLIDHEPLSLLTISASTDLF